VGNEVSDTGKDFSDIGKNIRKSGNAVEMKDLGQNQPEIGIFNHGWAWMNTNCALQPGKSGGGPPQSKTWRKFGAARPTRSVLECASPLALWNGATDMECDGTTSLLECGDISPLSSTRHVASDQSADMSAHSKAECRRGNGARGAAHEAGR
jgi:hypothetical protein